MSSNQIKSLRRSFAQFMARVPDPVRSAYLCSRIFYRTAPSVLRSGLIAGFGGSWPCFCPTCENPVPAFAPLPKFYFRNLELNDSDLRIGDFETCNVNAYQCPHCGAADRDRLYALHLCSRIPVEPSRQANFRLLDIAPAPALSAFIRRKFRVRYRTADLFIKDVDDRVDITSMTAYEDGSFDAFICSHVLEHVDNDKKAMAELYRVLKPGGWGIAMAPINLALKTVREDPSKTTEEERWKYFGQGDHVRVYSRQGFVERLQQASFTVKQLGQSHFGRETMARCGLSPASILYIVEKPQSKPADLQHNSNQENYVHA